MPKINLRQITFLRSLKGRIFLILLVVGLIPCFIMRHAILQNYEQRAVNVRTSDISTQVRILANHLITYHYLQDTSSEVINAELDQLSNLYDGRVLIINADLRIVKDTYGISEGKTIISEEVIRCLGGESANKYDRENGYIEMTIPITETVEAEMPTGVGERIDLVRGVMLVSASNDSIIATMNSLNRQAVVVESIVGVLIFVLALLVSKFLFAPFKKIIQALDQVREGYTSDPISVTDCLETEHIGDAFNRVLGRMKMLDDSRQEFVSNVSHELRTPITSMKVLADSLITQQATLLNPRCYSALDETTLRELEKSGHRLVVTLEDGVLIGGFGERIARFYGGFPVKVLCRGAKKEFVDNIPTAELYERYQLTESQLIADILAAI